MDTYIEPLHRIKNKAPMSHFGAILTVFYTTSHIWTWRLTTIIYKTQLDFDKYSKWFSHSQNVTKTITMFLVCENKLVAYYCCFQPKYIC